MSKLSRASCAFLCVCVSTWALACGARPERAAARPSVRARVHKAIEAHAAPVWRVAFSPDGRLLASCSPDKTVKLWRVPDSALAQTLAHMEGVTSIAFSPDGRFIASGSREKGNFGTLWRQVTGGRIGGRGRTLRLWQAGDGALQQSLDGHPGDVHSVAFSRDGRWLATSGEEPTVTLWGLENSAAPEPR